jgi:hypothetical protein
VGQFQQGVVAELGLVAEVGQLVLGGVAAHTGGGQLIQQAGLADVVEADVAHGDVFLEDGAVAAPFGVALAQHHRVVGQVQDVLDRRAHHMCPTSSGIS